MTEPNEITARQLFTEGRTHNGWLPRAVEDTTLVELYELLRMGPTSANNQLGRFVFVKSAEAKEKLRGCLMQGNVAKTMAAPVTAIVATDDAFHEHLPRLFPAVPGMKDYFASLQGAERDFTLTQNGSLQAAYLILAARTLGLGAGPMAGFDRGKVDAAFFAGTKWRSILLVNLGYGDPSKLYPRGPRLEFTEACRID